MISHKLDVYSQNDLLQILPAEIIDFNSTKHQIKLKLTDTNETFWSSLSNKDLHPFGYLNYKETSKSVEEKPGISLIQLTC